MMYKVPSERMQRHKMPHINQIDMIKRLSSGGKNLLHQVPNVFRLTVNSLSTLRRSTWLHYSTSITMFPQEKKRGECVDLQ